MHHPVQRVQLGQGEERPRLAVFGCGGAGCNTIRYLPPTPQMEIIALNDVPHPSMAGIRHRLLFTEEELEAVATLEDSVAKGIETDMEKELARELIGFDMVVVIAGLGGNTGGHAANVVARVARLHNIPTWAIVTLPFSAEGFRRREESRDSLDRLRKRSPAILTFTNDQLLEIAPDIPIAKAFSVMGQIMVKPLDALSRILTGGDMRPFREFLGGCRELRLGIGEASGPNRSFEAVAEALSSPWMKFDVEGARQAMVLVSGALIDEALTTDVLHCVSLKTPLASLLWGSYTEGQGDRIRVCVMMPPPR